MLPDSAHGVAHRENDTAQQGAAGTWCAAPVAPLGPEERKAWHTPATQLPCTPTGKLCSGTNSSGSPGCSLESPGELEKQSQSPYQPPPLARINYIRISLGRTQALFLKRPRWLQHTALQTFTCVWISWRSCPNADSDSFIHSWGRDLRCCGSNEMPGDNSGASPRTPVWGAKI